MPPAFLMLGDDGLAFLVEKVGDDHGLGALAGEQPRGRGAHAARRAADQRDLVLHAHGACLLLASGELEADDAGDDQARSRRCAWSRRNRRTARMPSDEGADRADAGPHRVGGAHRDGALCPQKQRAAGRHGRRSANRIHQPAGRRSVQPSFRPSGQPISQHARQYKIQPSHALPPSARPRRR